jgi:isoleucyl-tRNA synthetase
VALADMPELERLMLHRLSELDEMVRKGYDAFDFKRIAKSLSDFMIVDLSAFYFDIRKDALYCDAPSSVRRKAAIVTVRHLFDCLVTWLAPMMPFTMEEAWLDRYPQSTSVHLEQFREIPAEWRDEALAVKWRKIRQVRRVVTGALELERAKKTIGSSLEAAPFVHVTDAELLRALDGIDFAEICITSGIAVSDRPAPEGAFALDDVAGGGAGAQVRAILALHRRRRFRRGVPGRVAPRRPGTARVEGARPALTLEPAVPRYAVRRAALPSPSPWDKTRRRRGRHVVAGFCGEEHWLTVIR